MSANSDRRLGDEAVSEVLSFILGFFMAFLILMTTLYTFSEVNSSARELSAQAQARDIAQRIALGVQEAFEVALARNDTQASIESAAIRYNRTITVPDTFQGWRYTVSLDAQFVNATVIGSRNMVSSVPTFGAGAEAPPLPSDCSSAFVLCRIAGSATSGTSRFVVSYQFNATRSPVLNEITLA